MFIRLHKVYICCDPEKKIFEQEFLVCMIRLLTGRLLQHIQSKYFFYKTRHTNQDMQAAVGRRVKFKCANVCRFFLNAMLRSMICPNVISGISFNRRHFMVELIYTFDLTKSQYNQYGVVNCFDKC